MKKLLAVLRSTKRNFSSTAIYFLLILLLAFIARVTYLNVIVGPNTYPSNIDSIEHHLIAQNLAEGNGYSMYGHSTAYRAPFLTYFMALCYWIFGVNFAVVRIGIILMSLFLIWTIYLLGKELFNHFVGIWAALIAAIYPHFIFYNSRIFTETPFILFSLLALLFFVKFCKADSLKNLFLTALFLALAILTRPVGFVLLFLILLFILFKQRRWMNIKNAGVLLVTVIIFISPWIVRNYTVFKRFVPVTTQGAVVVWVGNNHYIAHHPLLRGAHALYQYLPGARKLITDSEIERSHYALVQFLDFLKQYPEDIPILIWNKTVRFWEKEFITGSSRRWMYEFSYLFITIFAAAGLVLSMVSNKKEAIYLLMLFVANFIPALIFWSGARIRLPAEPVFILFAAFCLEKIRGRILR